MKTRHPHPQGRMHLLHASLSAVLLLFLLVGGTVAPAAAMPPVITHTAPAQQQITLGKSEQSDFSPDGKASYGEIITYTLRYTITEGTYVATSLNETFSDPAYPYAYLHVTYRYAEGPFAQGSTPPVSPISPTVNPHEPKPVISWNLGTITVPAGSTYIYEVRYHVLVKYDNNGNAWRKAYNSGNVTWSSGNSNGASSEVTLVVPENMAFEKQQYLAQPDPYQEIDPGGSVRWALPVWNNTAEFEGTAYDVLITDTMPSGMIFDSCAPSSCSQVGQDILWDLPSLAVNGHEHFTLTAHLPWQNNIAHAPIFNNGYMLRSSAPGDVYGERVWPEVQRTTNAYVRNIQIDKEQTSAVFGTTNNEHQAEAGELVRITVTVTVPEGVIIYNPWMRILLEDGLELVDVVSPTTPYSTTTDPLNQDIFRPGGYWTQLTWYNQASITNTTTGPVSFTYILDARVNQRYTLAQPPQRYTNILHGSLLRIVPIVRWAAEVDGEPTEDDQYLRQKNEASDVNISVQFIRPDLRYQNPPNSGSYFEQTGTFEGGAIVDFELHLKQRNEYPVHPTAYDVVLTNTLSPNLTFVSASPAPDDPSCPGGVCKWTLPYDMQLEQHNFTITAQLPAVIVAGTAVTSTARASYSTLDGDNPPEGIYYDVTPENPPYTAQDVFRGGLAVAKTAETTMGGQDVRIGDVVTYTINMTVNKGIIMYVPTFEDVLPRGFHYVDGSMTIAGGVISSGPVVTRTGNSQDKINWGLETVDNSAGATPMYVVITYVAELTGLDWEDNEVYANGAGEFMGRLLVLNQVNTCWRTGTAPGASLMCLTGMYPPPAPPYRQATNYVVQPWLATNYAKTLNEAVNEFEVGAIVHYYVTIQNQGWGPAYDIVLTDTLPAGVAINGPSWLTLDPETPPVVITSEPVSGSTGIVTWTLDTIGPYQVSQGHGQIVQLHYNVQILDYAAPGDPLVNQMRIAAYSSQPGISNPYDRQYKRWDDSIYQPDPIPEPASAAPFYVRGLTVTKTDDPHTVDPGQQLTYHIEFSNTSALYDAEYIRITDTYDIDTTYVSWTGNDAGIYLVRHDVGTHTIIWGLRRIVHNDPKVYGVDMVVTVNEPLHQEDQLLTNWVWIDGIGDISGVVARSVDTNVRMPFLQMEHSASPATVYPDQDAVFTIDLTNIGVIAATDVVLTSDYDSNVTFVSAVPAPDTGTNNQWTFAQMDPNASQQVQVTVHVNKPFPSGVYSVTNGISVQSAETYEIAGPSASVAVSVPILDLVVTASPSPVNPGDQISYRIDYVNTGEPATGAVLTVDLDQYADTYVGASPTPPDNGCAGGVCVWTLGDLIPGVGGSITLLVNADSDIPGYIVQIRAVTSIESAEVGPNVVTTDIPLAGRAFSVYLPIVFKNANP